MTRPRQRDIKKAMNIRSFILVLVFLCFWSPIMYLWAWMVWPLEKSLIIAFCFGVVGTFFLYLPWNIYGIKLDRLLKYDVLFGPFFEAMIIDMEANDEEKGDSWLTMEPEDLVALQNRKIYQMQRKTPFVDNLSEQPKLANYSAMIYLCERYADEERDP